MECDGDLYWLNMRPVISSHEATSSSPVMRSEWPSQTNVFRWISVCAVYEVCAQNEIWKGLSFLHKLVALLTVWDPLYCDMYWPQHCVSLYNHMLFCCLILKEAHLQWFEITKACSFLGTLFFFFFSKFLPCGNNEARYLRCIWYHSEVLKHFRTKFDRLYLFTNMCPGLGHSWSGEWLCVIVS